MLPNWYSFFRLWEWARQWFNVLIVTWLQAYYLCYSLLALANEASNFEFFPPEQKVFWTSLWCTESHFQLCDWLPLNCHFFILLPPNHQNQLQYLCAQLEKHIKCDIRESEKCLYRSKVDGQYFLTAFIHDFKLSTPIICKYSIVFNNLHISLCVCLS